MGPEQKPQETAPVKTTVQSVSGGAVNPAQSAPAVLPTKKSKKGLVIGLISAGVVALGLIGGWVTYAFVYNSPENAVLDALSKVVTAKSGEFTGTMTTKSDGSTTKLSFSSATNEAGQSYVEETMTVTSEGKDYVFKINTAGTKDSVLVKLNDLRTLIDQSLATDPESKQAIDEFYGPLLDKVDNKWVEIKMSDLDSLTNGAIKGSQVTCLRDNMAKITTDSGVKNELSDVYAKHKFLTVESKGSDSMGNRYALKIDETKVKDYAKAMVETKYFKAMDKCVDGSLQKLVDSAKQSQSSGSNDPAPTIEVWVDGWSHNLNKVTMTSKTDSSEVNMEMLPKIGTNPKVTIPKSETSVDEVKNEIENIFQMFSASLEQSTVEDEPTF